MTHKEAWKACFAFVKERLEDGLVSSDAPEIRLDLDEYTDDMRFTRTAYTIEHVDEGKPFVAPLENAADTAAASQPATASSATMGGSQPVVSTATFRKVKIFVASPSDVSEERNLVEGVVARVNRIVADRANFVFEVSRYEHALPGMGRPQSRVNPLVEQCDVFIGILWNRFGSVPGLTESRKAFASGTQEEFHLAFDRWRRNGAEERSLPRIMIYFSERPATPSETIDPNQASLVTAFKREFGPNGKHPGLFTQYHDATDFERKLRDHLETLALQLGERASVASFTPDPGEIELTAEGQYSKDYDAVLITVAIGNGTAKKFTVRDVTLHLDGIGVFQPDGRHHNLEFEGISDWLPPTPSHVVDAGAFTRFACFFRMAGTELKAKLEHTQPLKARLEVHCFPDRQLVQELPLYSLGRLQEFSETSAGLQEVRRILRHLNAGLEQNVADLKEVCELLGPSSSWIKSLQTEHFDAAVFLPRLVDNVGLVREVRDVAAQVRLVDKNLQMHHDWLEKGQSNDLHEAIPKHVREVVLPAIEHLRNQIAELTREPRSSHEASSAAEHKIWLTTQQEPVSIRAYKLVPGDRLPDDAPSVFHRESLNVLLNGEVVRRFPLADVQGWARALTAAEGELPNLTRYRVHLNGKRTSPVLRAQRALEGDTFVEATAGGREIPSPLVDKNCLHFLVDNQEVGRFYRRQVERWELDRP